MFPLVYYMQFLSDAQLNAHDALLGYLLELAVKDFFNLPLVISPFGKRDLKADIFGGVHYLEVKENGGDFRYECHGSSFIAYSIFIDMNKPLNQQFGYIMPMKTFKACGYSLNHIRNEKKDNKGNVKMSLQTLYNYKQNDFHGKKAFKLADVWESSGAVTFKDFFVK